MVIIIQKHLEVYGNIVKIYLLWPAVNFDGANNTDSFNFKNKLTGQINDDGIINVEILVPLKYLCKFWRTFEMPLINCEFELILTWSRNSVIISTNIANQNPTFKITKTNLYVPVVTL